ncbi:MAG: deoxyguanosinetriphosphate triphosphohydrolase [Planctomycetota bacterium]|nr:deoxyguanosinetriphosphate triphosphohydrolase [Planctomycetota bacterium]
MRSRADIEAIEEKTLAPCAAFSARSRGRVHPEDEPPYRSAYLRDRDRIIHSSAFRRLTYKTQVFINHEGDHYRTRMTHTLEVAQIARTIARALALNEDLTEALALAHDLGHPPFGHSGESALDSLMSDSGGFDHNRQGLRIVDVLERRYPDFAGLNLTFEVREGFAKGASGSGGPSRSRMGFPDGEMPTLEAQVVAVADEIAYDAHDLDDGLASGIISEAALASEPAWAEAAEDVAREYAVYAEDDRLRRRAVVRRLINRLVTDLVMETERRLVERRIGSLDDVRRCPVPLVGFAERTHGAKKSLEAFLTKSLYRHPRVLEVFDRAKRYLSAIFRHYVERPDVLPADYRARIPSDGLKTVICDYVAGMTDRFAIGETRRIFGSAEDL